MLADMAADMEVDKVADMVADKKNSAICILFFGAEISVCAIFFALFHVCFVYKVKVEPLCTVKLLLHLFLMSILSCDVTLQQKIRMKNKVNFHISK